MKNFQFYLLFTAIFLSSCIKDSEEFIPDKDPVINLCSIIGIVNDESGNPIKNARISYLDQQRYSDDNGIYIFQEVKVNDKHNFLNVEKEGFFNSSRTFRSPLTAEIRIENKLLSKEFIHEIESNQGATISVENVEIDFQPNSFMYENSGLAYSGTVKVAVKNIATNEPQFNQKMPGDLSGISKSERISALKPYGMVVVELQSPNGELLNISTDKTAKLKIRVPDELIDETPDELSAWYFDEDLAFWKEEYSASLDENVYTAEVGHFSYWAYLLDEPAIVLSGKFVDENDNPLPDLGIVVNKLGEGWAAVGYTNFDGTFSGNVPVDTELELQVYGDTLDCQNGELLATYLIGPFNSDTQLPDFTLELPSVTMFTLSGMVEDCDEESVTEGYAKIVIPGYDTYFAPITNGQFSATNLICGDQSYELTVVDIENAQQSQVYTGSVSTTVDVNIVSACGTDISYTIVNIPLYGLDNFVLPTNSATYSNITESKITASNYDSETNSDQVYMNMGWDDGPDTTSLQTGTFDIDYFDISVWMDGFLRNGPYTVNSGTITVTSGGIISSNSKFKGTYSLEAVHTGTSEVINASGSFYISL